MGHLHFLAALKSAAAPFLLTLVLLVTPPASRAHSLSLAQADAQIATNGEYSVQLEFDVVALMAGVDPFHLRDAQVEAFSLAPPDQIRTALADAALRLKREFAVLAQDGTETNAATVELPSETVIVQAIRESIDQKTQPSNLVARLAGVLPAGTKEVRLRFPDVLGAVSVRTSIGGGLPTEALHLPGEIGPPYELTSLAAAGSSPPMSRREVLRRYTILGFTHILPKGIDHVLFVLGLFLLATHWRPLLWQVTAFTLAHSITLAMAMYDVVDLPPRIVEPLIALSIAFVALENLFTQKLHAWRPVVVFCFGLIHGLGFAGVLLELGLPRGEFGPALVAFNVGVEGGQLAVIALAFAATGWFCRKPWYRNCVTIPASVLIALTGLYWTVERIGF